MTTDTMRAEFEAWAEANDLNPAHPGMELPWAAFQFAWRASAEAERGRVSALATTALEMAQPYVEADTKGQPHKRWNKAMIVQAAISDALAALNRTAPQQET